MERDQATRLRRKVASDDKKKQAKVISFVSGKGGVGKSNIALNFSLELLNKDKKVLLIDLDIGMGNVEILQGIHANKTIVNMFEEHLDMDEIIQKGINNLSFISGGSGLTDFFHMDDKKADYFYEQFELISYQYDYILLDMGANATKDSMIFILASNECMVVTTPEPTAMTDAYSMVKHVHANQPEMPLYIILNRSTSIKTGLKRLERFKRLIKQFLQKEVYVLGQLPDDPVVTNAVQRQIPFVVFNQKSQISRAIGQIANNYVSNRLEEKTYPTSFIQKIKKLIRER